MPQMEWVWVAALAVFAIAEGCTQALISIWFIGGSIAGLISTVCGAPLWMQLTLFLAVSVLLLLLMRPMSRGLLSQKKTKTNAQSNVGKTVLVTEPIDNLRQTGAVKVSGVEWSARSVDGRQIAADTAVRIDKIEGAKVLVSAVQTKGEK